MTFVGDVLSSQYELVPAEVHFIPLACRGVSIARSRRFVVLASINAGCRPSP